MFHHILNNRTPKSTPQQNLLTAEVFFTGCDLFLYQFSTKSVASILHRDFQRITLFWEDIRESRLDENLNSVLSEGLG
jgi:hypothetical protein